MSYIVPDDYPDIQSAIDAGPDGVDLDVLLRPNLYLLNPVMKWPPNQIVVRPRLTLRGESLAKRDSTIIQMSSPELATSMRKNVITSLGDIDSLIVQDITVDQKAVPDNMGSSVVSLREGVASNITYRRLRVRNGFGAGLGMKGTNILCEDNIIDNVWTGITGQAHGFIVRRNDIRNTIGNAVYPQRYCTNGLIEDNYLESAGDVAIDITSNIPNPPHDNIVTRNNKILKGHIRVTNAINCPILNNKMEYGLIIVDGGQAVPINIRVEGNEIITDRPYAIKFAGARECDAIDNKIRMLEPPVGTVGKQVGMSLAIRGPSTIEGNEIVGARDYAMDFGGWRMGSDLDMTILDNILANFGDVGLYDNGLPQNNLRVLRNKIFSDLPTARWGILTDEVVNSWLIESNALKVGTLIGDAAISAPGSTLLDNIEFTPGPSLSSISSIALWTVTGAGVGYSIGKAPGAVIGASLGTALRYMTSRYIPPALSTVCIECGKMFMFTTYGILTWCPNCGEEQIVERRG